MGLNVVLLCSVLLYAYAGIVGLIQLHTQEEFHFLWSLLSGFCFFSAVGLVRMSNVARFLTVMVLWINILLFASARVLNPSGYAFNDGEFPINPKPIASLAFLFLKASTTDDSQHSVVMAFLLMFSLIGVYVLGRNKHQFR